MFFSSKKTKNRSDKYAKTIAIMVFFSCLFAVVSVSSRQAKAANSQIAISAHVLNNDKTSLKSGRYEVRFAIYSADRQAIDPYPSNSDAVSRVWEEIQTVEVKDGLISAYLGAVNPLPASLTFSNNAYYFGIRIENDSEMVPRKKIASVPTAIDSTYLQGKTIGKGAGDIPLIGTGGILDQALIPKITKLGTVSIGTWQGTQIADKYIADSLNDKVYNGLNLTADAAGFNIIGGTNQARLAVIENSSLDQDLLTASTPSFNGLTLVNALSVANGGTGISSYRKGDLLYALDAVEFGKLNIGSATQVLSVENGLPVWKTLDLSSALSGTLPIVSGGTNTNSIGTAGSVVYSDGIKYDFTSQGIAGQVLFSSGNGTPFWGSLTGGMIASDSLGFSELLDNMTLDSNLTIDSTANHYSVDIASGLLFIDSANGRVGIGTSVPARTLDINGNVNVAGNLQASSLTINGSAVIGMLGLNIAMNSSLIPSASGLDLGSSDHHWANLYADSLAVGTLDVQNSNANGTSSQYFVINSAALVDEDMGLRFYRSSSDGYAALNWNAGAEQFKLFKREGFSVLADLNLNNLYLGGGTIIGGAEVTDSLVLKGTSGNGILTSPAVSLKGGNNGSINILTALNNGKVGIGTTTPSETFEVVGDAKISGNLQASSLSVSEGATIGTLGLNISINSSLIPSVNGLNLGSSTNHWANIYVDNLSVEGANVNGTSSKYFAINIDSLAEENMGLRFYRPNVNSYASLGWDMSFSGFKLLNNEGAETLAKLNLSSLFAENSVGIGTTSPSYLLSLGGTSARTFGMERNTTAATAGQGLTITSGGAYSTGTDLAGGDLILKSGISTGTGTSAIRFHTATAGSTGSSDNNQTEKMAILGNGNVGIGTSSPEYMLDVNGTVRLNSAGNNFSIGSGWVNISNGIRARSGGFILNNDVEVTFGYDQFSIGYDSSTGTLRFVNSENLGTNVRMVMNKPGNVGIGTTSPSYLLSLGGTSARTFGMERNTTAATAGQGLTITSGGAYSTGTDLAGGDLILKSGISTGAGTSAIRFYTSSAGSTGSSDNDQTEKMAILGNGNVGIGTTSPASRLHLASSPVASANYGTLSIGGGAFDGSTTGKFVGVAGGTSIAVNEASGYAGKFLDMQIAGSSKFSISSAYLVHSGTVQAAQINSTGGRFGSNTTVTLALSMSTTDTYSTASSTQVSLAEAKMAQTSGTNYAVRIIPTYNQISGTAANTDLLINRTQTAVGSGNQYLIDAQVDGASKFNVTNTGTGYFAGNVGIGTTSPAYKLAVNGEPAANGYTAFTNYSDARLKKNIQGLPDGVMDKIMTLNPSTFNYNDLTGYDQAVLDRTITGFIAQDLMKVFPEMVGTTFINGKEYYDTNLSALPIYIIKGMQEQQVRIQGLDEGISSLNLKTDANITTISELQISVDSQLAMIGTSLNTINTTQNATDENLDLLDAQFADSKKIIDQLQVQVELIKQQNQALTDFITILDPAKLIYKDALGNLDLTNGKLEATEISTGVLTVKIVDAESPTIGSAVICPKMKELDKSNRCSISQVDADDDGVDDMTENEVNDGESVKIKTRAVGENTKIYITPVGSTKNQVLYIGNMIQADGFTVKVDNATSEDIGFNWWIVKEEE